ncbi:hypothetical protein R3P38DRAFT_3178980 [Favolaschia claudopus]|uniref:Uncharacterized protein n=1 Tax=Favolaschia claudopus TaxID=2862362 RepID=A0AAW0CUK0_9AGAR
MSHIYQPGATPQMSEQRPPMKQEDSLMKTVGKKYAGGAAKKAGSESASYVKDHHEEIEEKAGEEYDKAKAEAEEQYNNAKQTWAKIFPCCG